MLGNSCVAAQLVASQEGLSSMELDYILQITARPRALETGGGIK
jgi:hypothetical protein